MTSRRAIPTYEQRMSRALQFHPGHAGGRVDSAQPIRRRGGTLRGPAVGGVGAAPPPVDHVLPASYGSTYYNSSNYAWDPNPQSIPAFHGSSTKTPGDMFVSLAVVDGGASVPTVTPPTGWTALGSGAQGTAKWALVGINSYTGAEGTAWTLSGLTHQNDFTGHIVMTYHLKGGTGFMWTPATVNSYANTRTGTWSAPSSGGLGAVAFVASAGFKSVDITPTPANTYPAGRGSSSVSPRIWVDPDADVLAPNVGEIFTVPRPTGSFTLTAPSPLWPEDERSGAMYMWAVTVGLA